MIIGQNKKGNWNNKIRENAILMQYLKTNINKQKFIKIYLDFLNERDLIPLDIINAKIEVIDFLYVPFYAETIEIESHVSAQIGRYVKRYKPVYNKDLKINVAEEYTETEWHSEKFPVRSSINNVICTNKEFFSLVGENFLTLNQNLISSMTDSNEKYRLLEINLDKNTIEKKRDDLVNKKIGSLIIKQLKSRGDDYKNESRNTTYSISSVIAFYLPVGYIKYNYNNKSYYFVISLYNGGEEKIKISTPPVDNELKTKIDKSENIFFITFWSYLLFAGLIYYLSTMTGFAHIYTIFWVVIIVVVGDLIWLKYNKSKNYKENISKRKQILDKIFEKESDKLIDLVLNLEKPYKKG